MARPHRPCDALPFLTRASRVTVIELCTSDEHGAAQLRVRDVAKYLERHGRTLSIRGLHHGGAACDGRPRNSPYIPDQKY
jgi:hypothetical protein